MNQEHESTAQSNNIWGEVVAHTLYELGISNVFFSPGSRSTPLVLGFERHPQIKCVPVLDERSAAFIALGFAKRTKKPTCLLCTSGSAPTHWFPAVTEASHASIPLLLLSADRPPELRDCGAGQTINQIEIFGTFVRSFFEINLPSSVHSEIQSLRQTLAQAYTNCLGVNPGPVHLNFPFREPFIPKQSNHLHPLTTLEIPSKTELQETEIIHSIQKEIKSSQHPIIVAGERVPAKSLLDWFNQNNVPVFCDSLSPLRENIFESSILRYENLLRDPSFLKSINPDLILVLGALPTSKTLRKWIEQCNAKRIIIEPRGINIDPLSTPSLTFQIDYNSLTPLQFPACQKKWNMLWQEAESLVESKLELAFKNELPSFEGKLIRLLSENMPTATLLQVANSMPIRDLEWFWKPSPKNRRLFGNRGVNGIDGTLGTAIGLAHQSGSPTFLVSGELAFLHDSNALLFSRQFEGSLTIFLINNNGGGIFENLPIAEEPEFEKCFATPQCIKFDALCHAHQIKHEKTNNWDQIIKRIDQPISSGIQVIEILTDRKADRITRQRLLGIGTE